jgi:hypothetical protein
LIINGLQKRILQKVIAPMQVLGVWQFFPQLSLQTKNGTSKNNKPSKNLFCVLPKKKFSDGNTSQREGFFSFPNKK